MRTRTISSLSPEYQELKKLFPSLGKKPPKPDPVKSEPVDGPALLHDIAGFIGRYLHCSQHQRHLLALWALHTWCSSAAQITPYLAVLSPEPRAGKTLCLQLLSLLCHDPSLTSTLSVRTLIDRMFLRPPSAILLDDAQSILGSRSRSRNPTLRGLLANGSHLRHGALEATRDRHAFCPKAFAITGQLPDDLAQHSVPIILQPLPRREGLWFSPNGVQRFDLSSAGRDAEVLKQRLSAWSRQHLQHLQQRPVYAEQDFPQCLSPLHPRRMQLVEPLLQLADEVAGPWPGHIRQALDVIFDEGDHFHLYANRQLLQDLHLCFSSQGYPERLSTAFLLDWLHSQQDRSWQAEGLINAHRLAQLLGAFEITPRVQRTGPRQTARGYRLADFQQPWRRHMGVEIRRDPDGNFYAVNPALKREPAAAGELPSSPCPETAVSPAMNREPAVTHEPSEVTPQKSEIARNDAVCYGVTHAAAAPVSGRQNEAPVEEESRDQSVVNLPVPHPAL